MSELNSNSSQVKSNSHHITSHHITPRHTTSHLIAPHHITSRHIISYRLNRTDVHLLRRRHGMLDANKRKAHGRPGRPGGRESWRRSGGKARLRQSFHAIAVGKGSRGGGRTDGGAWRSSVRDRQQQHRHQRHHRHRRARQRNHRRSQSVRLPRAQASDGVRVASRSVWTLI